jgi:hypothetical protein
MSNGLQNVPAYVVYNDEQRRGLYPRILQLRYGPFEKTQRRATWDKIAEAVGVTRQTISNWRDLDDYKHAETKHRTLMREEARTDASGMAQAAVDHIFYLMTHASSDFVQLEAAKTITVITQLDKELAERELQSNEQLVEFQKLLLSRKRDAQALRDMGIDPTSIIDMEVLPGGLLPEAVVVQNQLAAEQYALISGLEDEGEDTDL